MSRSVRYTSSPLLASKTPVGRSRFIVAAIALGFIGLGARAAYVQVYANDFFQRQGTVRFARTLELPPQQALQRTIEHREIFFDEMLSLMRQIMAGEISPVMTAAILTGLRVKKETISEITAAATVMREMSTKVVVEPPHDHFLDVVGTGGDGANTFNISTTTIFVAAAGGVFKWFCTQDPSE